MKRSNIWVAVVLLFGMTCSGAGFADVRVFRAEQEPVLVKSESSDGLLGLIGAIQGRLSPLNQVLDAVNGNRELFGMSLGAADLRVVRAENTEDGLAVRFQQVFNDLAVDGAEVVALFDQTDTLDVLNTSLINVREVSTKPEISQKKAVKFAIQRLGLSKAELMSSEPAELKIAVRDGESVLVWQFVLAEKDRARAYRVQVIAAGPKQGELFKVLSLNTEVAQREIYDASVTIVIPNPIFKGVQVLENGKKTLIGEQVDTTEAQNADRSLARTYNYYLRKFNRRSFDNHDAPLIAAVNASKYLKEIDVLGMQQNAAWMGPWQMFVFGAGGDMLGSFTESLDVVAHEFTHAVISSSSNLEYASQSGGLNEHFADVFGVTVENAYERPAQPFLVGDKCLRGELARKAPALRDMLNPHRSLGGQPAHMREIDREFAPGCQPSSENDNCGVHNINGVPNRAAALIIQALGWEESAKMFYRVMTVRLRSTSKFADYRNQMVDECQKRRGAVACEAVVRAFANVGL